jgi:prepilin peptidase CpaA
MNLFASAPAWLAWVLAALLVAAALEDAIRLRISNLICVGVLAGALIAMAVAGPDIALWQNGLVFAALLGGGTLLFAKGVVGGGDVKLLAAVGLWCNLTTAFFMLTSVFLSGGVLALLILGARTFAPAGAAARVVVLRPRAGIPYGIAIAAGALLTLVLQQG